MSTQLENDFTFDSDLYQQKLPQYYRSVLSSFQKAVHAHMSALIFSFFPCIFGNFSFFCLFAALMGSSLLAGAIGVLFLTLFSYLILLFYYQAKNQIN